MSRRPTGADEERQQPVAGADAASHARTSPVTSVSAGPGVDGEHVKSLRERGARIGPHRFHGRQMSVRLAGVTGIELRARR
jgi:hypothetical protein